MTNVKFTKCILCQVSGLAADVLTHSISISSLTRLFPGAFFILNYYHGYPSNATTTQTAFVIYQVPEVWMTVDENLFFYFCVLQSTECKIQDRKNPQLTSISPMSGFELDLQGTQQFGWFAWIWIQIYTMQMHSLTHSLNRLLWRLHLIRNDPHCASTLWFVFLHIYSIVLFKFHLV